MRTIDADAFCNFLREVSTRQHYETLLTNKDKYPTVADVIEEICCELDGTSLNGFDNAPTVDTDLSGYSDKLWETAYDRGKNDRPKGKWIKESKLWGGFGDSVLVNTCSECGESFIYHGNNPNYCPNCGAYMRGDDYGS